MIKLEARKIALKRRIELYNDDLNNLVVKKLIPVIKDYKNIGIYYPIGKEINILSIMDIYPDKNFYLPITNEEISFVKYNKGDALYDGLFNTKEPKGTIVDRSNIDCFIIPCLAISKSKKRLGYGKGYYDRYLSNYNGIKIGVIYKELNNLDFIDDDFDVVLNIIIEG